MIKAAESDQAVRMSAEASMSGEAAMARAGRTFYLASRLLPKGVRGQVVELYRFCREVDDVADGYKVPVADRQRLLAAIRRDLICRGRAAVRAGWTPELGGRSPVMKLAAAELVDAARGDLAQRQPKTEEDLVRYAFGVAGTVGLMLCELLGAEGAGQPAAVHLGIAMQLTNIARDVAEDARAGRVYLPVEWIGGDEVEHALGGAAEAQAMLKRVTGRLLQTAESYYRSAYTGMGYLPVRVRWSILAAALCYREIGVRVARDFEMSWTRRAVVSMGRKLALVMKAGWLLLLPRFRRVPDEASRARTRMLCLPIAGELARMGISW